MRGHYPLNDTSMKSSNLRDTCRARKQISLRLGPYVGRLVNIQPRTNIVSIEIFSTVTQMYTKESPFSKYGVFQELKSGKYPAIPSSTELPPRIWGIVAKCWQWRPCDRPAIGALLAVQPIKRPPRHRPVEAPEPNIFERYASWLMLPQRKTQHKTQSQLDYESWALTIARKARSQV